jgi:hypothetical protein
MSDRIDAPNGYQFGNVNGHRLQHLVACEPFNATALCGTRVYFESLSSLTSSKVCKACAKKWGQVTAENFTQPQET